MAHQPWGPHLCSEWGPEGQAEQLTAGLMCHVPAISCDLSGAHDHDKRYEGMRTGRSRMPWIKLERR
jgi:hypothetical protein